MVTPPKAFTKRYSANQPPPLSEVRLNGRGNKQEKWIDITTFRWGNPQTITTVSKAIVYRRENCADHPLTFHNNLLEFRGSTHATDIARPVSFGPTQQTTCERAGWAFPFITHPDTYGKQPNVGKISSCFVALFGSLLAHLSALGPKEGYLFMKKRDSRRTINKDPEVQRLFSKGGWTRIKNTLLEALISNKTRLSKNEMQVVFAIVRKTWGYGKWSDRISRTQIQKITHLDLAVISHALKSLRERGILRKCQDYSYKNHTAYEWRIEDETDNWSQKSASSEDSSPMIKCTRNQMRKRPEQPMRNHLTTKESLSKDKIKYGQTSKAHTQNSVLEEDGVRYSI